MDYTNFYDDNESELKSNYCMENIEDFNEFCKTESEKEL